MRTSMCVCAMFVCLHMHMHVCVCVCVLVLVHVCVCLHIHMHACAHLYVCLDAINMVRGSVCVWCGAEMRVFGCLPLFVHLSPDEQIITITALCAR